MDKVDKKFDKPILVFTNFWEANKLVTDRIILCGIKDSKDAYKINLLMNKDGKTPRNFSVHSVALMSPKLDGKLSSLKEVTSLPRLDFFCPTYKLLQRYKKDRDWELYKTEYRNILKERKDRIKEWILSLESNHVYILCCWEDTSLKNVNCHRRIIFDAFKSSNLTKNKFLLIYRHGCRDYKQSNQSCLSYITLVRGGTVQTSEINDLLVQSSARMIFPLGIFSSPPPSE